MDPSRTPSNIDVRSALKLDLEQHARTIAQITEHFNELEASFIGFDNQGPHTALAPVWAKLKQTWQEGLISSSDLAASIIASVEEFQSDILPLASLASAPTPRVEFDDILQAINRYMDEKAEYSNRASAQADNFRGLQASVDEFSTQLHGVGLDIVARHRESIFGLEHELSNLERTLWRIRRQGDTVTAIGFGASQLLPALAPILLPVAAAMSKESESRIEDLRASIKDRRNRLDQTNSQIAKIQELHSQLVAAQLPQVIQGATFFEEISASVSSHCAMIKAHIEDAQRWGDLYGIGTKTMLQSNVQSLAADTVVPTASETQKIPPSRQNVNSTMSQNGKDTGLNTKALNSPSLEHKSPQPPALLGEGYKDNQVTPTSPADGTNESISLLANPAIRGDFYDQYLGDHSLFGKVTLKQPRFADSHPSTIWRFLRETDSWRRISHVHIMPFFETCTIGPSVYLVSPLAENGNLLQRIGNGQPLDYGKILSQIASAVAYLHTIPIVHGNIKAKNVQLSEEGSPLLCDFGLANAICSTQASATSPLAWGESIRWMAPELYTGGIRTKEADVYAFGMTIAEVLTGESPFHGMPFEKVVYEVIVQEARPSVPSHESLTWGQHCRLWAAAERCWVREVHERPSMDRVLESLSPRSNDISGSVTLVGNAPIATGGFGELYVGHHKSRGKVALKRSRINYSPGSTGVDEIRRFYREADLWFELSHPNILPFLGTCMIGRHDYMVSPFIPKGDLSTFIQNGGVIDHGRVLIQVAKAIAHLHSAGIVHGDIKGKNVLLSEEGSPLLCDFGLSKALNLMTTSSIAKGRGSTRWMAPELLDWKEKTFASDVYAFGMTIAEVLTGQPPFPEIVNVNIVIIQVLHNDARPPLQPLQSPDGKSYARFWEIAEKCWARGVQTRPNMALVLAMLRSTI